MIKITDIFNFEKWRGIKITLITVALVLTGCQPQAIQSTTTPTPTEIPATATLMPTNTPEPTATATELVLPDNAVEIVGGGYVFVESGKLMLLGADGVAKEVKDPSYDVVFNTMDDAKNILKNLNPEATNVTREDFFPGGYPTEKVYDWSVKQAAWYTFSDGSGVQGIQVVGIAKSFARVKNPINSPTFSNLGVGFFAVNGYQDLLPVPVGVFNTNGDYLTLLGVARNLLPKEYSVVGPSTFDPIFFSDKSWPETKDILIDQIMDFCTVYSVPPDASSTFAYTVNPVFDDYVPSEVRSLRGSLIHFQSQQIGSSGYQYAQTTDSDQTTGAMLDAVDEQQNGFFYLIPEFGTGPIKILHIESN